VDVTATPEVKVGDAVTLLGTEGEVSIDAQEIAKLGGDDLLQRVVRHSRARETNLHLERLERIFQSDLHLPHVGLCTTDGAEILVGIGAGLTGKG
jgi:hypothetical protein